MKARKRNVDDDEEVEEEFFFIRMYIKAATPRKL